MSQTRDRHRENEQHWQAVRALLGRPPTAAEWTRFTEMFAFLAMVEAAPAPERIEAWYRTLHERYPDAKEADPDPGAAVGPERVECGACRLLIRKDEAVSVQGEWRCNNRFCAGRS